MRARSKRPGRAATAEAKQTDTSTRGEARASRLPGCLGGTLQLAAQAPGRDRFRGAPLGIAAHGAAIGVFLFGALLSADRPVPPSLSRLVFHVAPPPPPPQLRGDPMALEASPEVPSAVVRETPVLTPRVLTVAAIPDDVLSPSFELPRGAHESFDEGSLNGLEGGIPGGVVGGVPGGLVGGQIGGTGTDLPRFPTPDVGPSPIRMPQPSYTRQAIRDNVSGAVRLRVVIDEQGRVEVLEVLKSVAPLDAEAIRVVESGWLFRPATKNGRPIPTLSELVVRFRLY